LWQLNNRELATLILAGAIVLAIGFFAARNRSFRASLKGVVKALFAIKVLTPILALVGWVIGLALLAENVGLWDDGLVFPAALWTITVGLGLIYKLASRRSNEPFFKPILGRAFRVTVFVEVVIGLFAFSLGLELVLLVAASFLAMLSVVARSDEKYEPARKLVDGLLGLIGLAFIALTVISLISDWDQLDKEHLLRQLALPLWLTIGVTPYLYLLAVWVGYEQAFMRINLASEDRRARRRAKVALVAALHGRAAQANAYSGAFEMVEADGFPSAWRAARKYLRAQGDQAQGKREEADRLKKFAGTDGTDEEGRRLDRREFKETRDALISLGTAHMGWYDRANRYRADLLEFFSMRGLPEEHGVEMVVSEDGQCWFAWRQTVTGWFFGIGSAGPPPDQWFYDGPQPPADFPGIDPGWGDHFGIEMKNW
jgi:hypothetical protein